MKSPTLHNTINTKVHNIIFKLLFNLGICWRVVCTLSLGLVNPTRAAVAVRVAKREFAVKMIVGRISCIRRI